MISVVLSHANVLLHPEEEISSIFLCVETSWLSHPGSRSLKFKFQGELEKDYMNPAFRASGFSSVLSFASFLFQTPVLLGQSGSRMALEGAVGKILDSRFQLETRVLVHLTSLSLTCVIWEYHVKPWSWRLLWTLRDLLCVIELGRVDTWPVIHTENHLWHERVFYSDLQLWLGHKRNI